jgi:hypothetical protein
VRTSPLPDFYVGTHAAVDGLTLLTRDAQRYAGYFPRGSDDRAGVRKQDRVPAGCRLALAILRD